MGYDTVRRCWDFCETQRVVLKTNSLTFVQSNSPLCSHAYMITKRGAQLLLQHSIPHVTSVDLLFALLSRTNHLKLLSLTPPLYTQARSSQSHDKTRLVECDKSGNRDDIRDDKDSYVMEFIKMSEQNGSMLRTRTAYPRSV